MSDFEKRLSDALASGADDAPDAVGLAAGARVRARRRRRTTAVLVAAAVVAVVAVPVGVVALRDGADPSSSDTATDRQPPEPGEPGPDVTCGFLSWPVSAMDGGVEGLVDEAEVRAAFADILVEAPMDAPAPIREEGADAVPFIALASGRSDGRDSVVLGVGPWSAESGPGDQAQYVSLERTDAGLDFSGWGECLLSVALPPGRSQVEVTAPPAGVDGGTTTPVVMANERECTSGRDPRPFLGEPVVVESADRVVVTLSSETAIGRQDCQGNPSVPITLALDEPIGDRELLDGGVWPPRPILVGEPAETVESPCPDGVYANSDLRLDPDNGEPMTVCRFEVDWDAESGGSRLLADTTMLSATESSAVRVAVAAAPPQKRNDFRSCNEGPGEFYLVLAGDKVPLWVYNAECGDHGVLLDDGEREVTPELLDALGSPYGLLR